MASNNRVFVSPGVYTSELDLTFVAQSVGVTTLGLAGETLKGPAFEPILISNFDDFKLYFGSTSPEKFGDGNPKYELGYVAKSYLQESNQLFVTRVLGFSGYDAGLAWGITLNAALDSSTIEVIATTAYDPLICFTANTAGVITNLTSADAIVQQLWDDGAVGFDYLASSSVGTLPDVQEVFYKNGLIFEGAEIQNFYLTTTASDANGVTGCTSGVTVTYSGTGYSDVENKIVLTGFKWIAKMVKDFPELDFIGGGEESFGFMVGDFVRDKDAVTASLLACEMASFAKAKGNTLMEELIALYLEHGCYQEHLVSITKKGKEGNIAIENNMKRLREQPLETIDGEKVLWVHDYLKATAKNLLTGEIQKIALPESNVLIYTTENGTKLAARPSGTEPKIKFYFSVNTELDLAKNADGVEAELDAKIQRIIKEMKLN